MNKPFTDESGVTMSQESRERLMEEVNLAFENWISYRSLVSSLSLDFISQF